MIITENVNKKHMTCFEPYFFIKLRLLVVIQVKMFKSLYCKYYNPNSYIFLNGSKCPLELNIILQKTQSYECKFSVQYLDKTK